MASEVYGLLESQISALQDARVYARAVCEWVGRLLVGARDNRLEVGSYRHVLPAIANLLDLHRIDVLLKRLETLDFLIEKVRIPVDVPVFSTERKLSVRSMEKCPSAHKGAVNLWNTFNGFLGGKVAELCPELGLALNDREAAGKLVDQHWETLRRDLAGVVQFDCEAIKEAIDRESQAAKEICNASLVSALAGSLPPAAKLAEDEGNGGTRTASGKEQSPIATGRESVLRQLQPADRKAYLSFQYVESKAGKRLEDREAYNLLKEEGIPTDKGDLGELADYELPIFATWSKQVRNARKPLDEQKYTCRGGRDAGRSIVLGRKIEYQKGGQ
jgi:hypothetical protein